MARSKRTRAPARIEAASASVPDITDTQVMRVTQVVDNSAPIDHGFTIPGAISRANVTIPNTQEVFSPSPGPAEAEPELLGETHNVQSEDEEATETGHHRRTLLTWQSELHRLGWEHEVVCDMLQIYEMKCKKQFFLTCDLVPRPDRVSLATDVVEEVGYSVDTPQAEDLVARLVQRSQYWKKNYSTRYLDVFIEHVKQCAAHRIGFMRMQDSDLQDFAATQFQTASLLELFPHARNVIDLERIRAPARPVTATAVDMRIFLKTLYVWSFFWTVRHCLVVPEGTGYKREMQAARGEVIEKLRALCRDSRWNTFTMTDLPHAAKRRKTARRASIKPPRANVLTLQPDYRTFGDNDVEAED